MAVSRSKPGRCTQSPSGACEGWNVSHTPRRVGAKLPLWVVIGPDGKIAHYHVGTYDVKPDEGLRRLDEVVVSLVKQNRPADETKTK